jgi:hypothetical protein
MTQKRGLEVDRRVGIAMSALTVSERVAVERIMRSLQSFERSAALPGRVRTLHTSGQPLFMMLVTPTLHLVYTFVGETVYILDLVEQATLDRFAVKKRARKATNGKVAKAKSNPRTRKAGHLVEK